jgi:glutaredoxin
MAHEGFRDPTVTVVYGLDTCEDTTRAREYLTAVGLDFRYVRLDVATNVRAQLHAAGYVATPVVVTPAGMLYVEPTDDELAAIVALAGLVE